MHHPLIKTLEEIRSLTETVEIHRLADEAIKRADADPTMKVFADVARERMRQEEKWGRAHDDVNTQADWRRHIRRHNEKGCRSIQHRTNVFFRQQMIRVAALAIAAIEAVDRQGLDR